MNAKTASWCLTGFAALLGTACAGGTDCDTYYADRDGDGFGNPDRSRFVCTQPRNFVRNNRDCDDGDESRAPTGTYEGDLIIDATSEGDLQAFIDACPGTVAGNVSIIGTDVTELDFLLTVSDVEGTLSIRDNDALTNLTSLQNLVNLGGLDLKFNDPLRDLDQLEGLENVGSLRLDLTLDPLGDRISTLEVFSDVTGLQELALNVTGIDDFTGLPELTSLTGDLLIGGGTLDSLLGVEAITTVGGDFTITGLGNPVGFETMALTSIGGNLIVMDSPSTTMVSLPNVTSVSGIDVRNNPALTTLNLPLVTTTGPVGFNSNGLLATVTTGLTDLTDLEFTNLPALTDVSGFSGLTGVTVTGLVVRNTEALTSLDGLQGIVDVTDGLTVVGNSALTSLTGLSGVTGVGTELQLVNNGLVTDLTGLEAITDVDTVTIQDNAALADLAGFDNVSVATGATVLNNPVLPAATVDSWAATALAENALLVNEGNNG